MFAGGASAVDSGPRVNEVANGFLVDMEFPTLYRANVKNLVKTAIGLNESFDDVYIEK